MNQQDEKDFQVSCQHVEPEGIERACTKLRACRVCKQTFPIQHFPPKGSGRREWCCGSCHNAWRRNKYAATHKKETYVRSDFGSIIFDKDHPGLNTLLDLICEEIIRKEVLN